SEFQTIHIVLIVVDNDTPKKASISICERVETLLKSILTFYSGTLHVHMLTNTRSGKTLSTLFRTSSLSRVRTSFYNVEEDQKSLAWIKSKHEVSGYGQMKYIIHDILPEYVGKVIFVDTDMLVLEDISILHSTFVDMEQKGIMFAATSDQYRRVDLEKSHGKGAGKKSVNSGLVLYNLDKMRAGDWSSLWRETGVRLMTKLENLICPQDLLAAVAISRPDTYMKLPCVYNFQIGKNALPWDCVKNTTELSKAKIPHWTGTLKYYEMKGHTAVFTPIYRCFQNMDGYDFEKDDGQAKHRTLLNLRNTKRAERPDDVTLATHVHYEDAIDLIQRLNATWLGPISLVVCGSSWERAQLLSFIFSNILHDSFDIHFVYQRSEVCPIFYLRRTAVDTSRTKNLLLSDSITSFQIDEDLHKKCSENTDTKSTLLLRNKKTSEFAGILLEKSFAQRMAAGMIELEEGIKTLKLTFNDVAVEPMVDTYINQYNLTKWELDKPSDSFCQDEIDRRR
ncbi:hypothetical protein PENTCL1PPCAC_15027, partial [Pristionchus entomophagus]